jgi:cadmium resistance protein CadD (predicted permease)
MKILTIIAGAFLGVLIVVLLSFLFAFPVKWLWNSTATDLFGFKEINVWMAWKLSLLCGLLIKGSSYSQSK